MRGMLTRTFRPVLFVVALAAFTAASLVTAQQRTPVLERQYGSSTTLSRAKLKKAPQYYD